MPPAVPPFERSWAFFLDLDGTLLDIAETPQAVDPGRVIELLGRLYRRAAGAVALISGRSLKRLDELFSPLLLPAAGLHGAALPACTAVRRRRAEGGARGRRAARSRGRSAGRQDAGRAQSLGMRQG